MVGGNALPASAKYGQLVIAEGNGKGSYLDCVVGERDTIRGNKWKSDIYIYMVCEITL